MRDAEPIDRPVGNLAVNGYFQWLLSTVNDDNTLIADVNPSNQRDPRLRARRS
jgi:hypothetical protein